MPAIFNLICIFAQFFTTITNMDTQPTFESSLKSIDTEEWLDIHFHRPMGYRWALLARRLGITPNQVTIFSIFVGMAGGVCFYFPDLWLTLLGGFFLTWANSLDCADGQLARMTGQKTELGRILDGAAGDFWWAAIYIGMIARLWTENGFFILIIVLMTAYYHSKQAQMADYYRQIHLLFLNGKNGSELDHSEEVEKKYQALTWKKPVFKFFRWTYLHYTKAQEDTTPKFQAMMAVIDSKYKGEAPKWLNLGWREKSLPILPITNMLSFNLRAIMLFFCVLFGQPWIYLVIELTVMNGLLHYMTHKYERLADSFTTELLES
ncbi:CDP-alcohol phosphatidyltransferase [Candidatus Symbiothrix dinenymphae]|nr:CDP-alcohol phosphatidyltransferase [Candidatus Symbiothrix dinenymphae]